MEGTPTPRVDSNSPNGSHQHIIRMVYPRYPDTDVCVSMKNQVEYSFWDK